MWSCKKDDKVDPVDTQVVADFTFTQGTAGEVTFKNTSKNATSYTWDFGDGSKSTEENPTHTYTKDGTYTIKLTATNAGGSAEKTRTVTISLEGTSTQLVANFTFAVDEKTAGKVTFTNTSEGATSYAWDFGDGNTSTDENPAHTYAKDDTYTVKLTATNAGGGSDNITKEVKITNSGITSIDIADLSQLVLPKNSPSGVVIWKIAATVANTDETPVYSITSQNPAGAIGLNGNKIVLADASAIDYDTNTELTGEIQATAGSATATAAFTISITDNPDEKIYIPDANFKAALPSVSSIDTNGDGEISVAEARGLTESIFADQLNITDASGIEYFINISGLSIQANALTEIDVSQNIALTTLGLGYNQLTAIDVSNNTALIDINIQNNQLTEIDVSNNTALTQLNLDNNQLTEIDVSNNTALTSLNLGDNQLTAIDVSNNTALTLLNLTNNQLTALDVSNLAALKFLYLDKNPNLTCIKVNDPSDIPSEWQKDATAKYQTDCN